MFYLNEIGFNLLCQCLFGPIKSKMDLWNIHSFKKVSWAGDAGDKINHSMKLVVSIIEAKPELSDELPFKANLCCESLFVITTCC